MTREATRTMSLSRDAQLNAAAAIVLTSARFAVAAIATRRLSQADFGVFAYTMWLIETIFLVCSLGAAGAVSRYVAEFRGNALLLDAFMRPWRRLAIGVPILAGVATACFARISGLPLASGSLFVMSLWAAAHAWWALRTAVLIGGQRFERILLANLLAGLGMVSGAALLPLQSGALTLLFALMAACATIGALSSRAPVQALGGETGSPLTKWQWRAIRAYAVNVWLSGLLAALVWSRGEFPIVQMYVGDAGVALYAAAMTLFAGAVQGVMLGVGGIVPQLTRLWGEHRVDDVLRTAQTVMNLQLLACGFVTLSLMCLAPELMTLSFGAQYRAAHSMVSILAIGLIPLSLYSYNHILQIATDARFSRDTAVAGLVLLMVLAFALIPQFGHVGAAVARVSTMILLAAVSVSFAIRCWGVMAMPLRNLLATSAVCLAVGGLAIAIGDSNLAGRLALLLLAVAALALILRSDGLLVFTIVARWAESALARQGRKGVMR